MRSRMALYGEMEASDPLQLGAGRLLYGAVSGAQSITEETLQEIYSQ